MGFWIGFIVGGITVPAVLALVSKPLMGWMARKQLTNMSNNIMQRLNGLQNQFPMEENGEKDSESTKE